MNKYPALTAIASLLRGIGVIVVLAGIALSIWFAYSTYAPLVSSVFPFLRMTIIVGILFYFSISGVLLYATGDFFRCVIDIETNTRITRIRALRNNS